MKSFKRVIAIALLAVVALTIAPSFPAHAAYGRCYQYEGTLARYSPGWSVSQMSSYMYRESRCTPWVRSSTRDTGLLQINDVNIPYLRSALREWVDSSTLKNPSQNIRAAAALCRYWMRAGRGCYYPWGG